jgi:hypothetical protein
MTPSPHKLLKSRKREREADLRCQNGRDSTDQRRE